MASAKRDIPIEAYPQAIRHCLANLVDNARRYAGGAVSLRIERHAGKIMDDDGPAIPPSERERVFEPHVRLDPSGGSQTGGSCLGLAIARALARTHGGDISIADRAGGGLRASLSLPLAAG
jgi:signal transduction histidine kinase